MPLYPERINKRMSSLHFSSWGSRHASASLRHMMRALLCSSIRVIGRSRMGMFFYSRPSNLGFLVRFSWFIVRMLTLQWRSGNLEPGTCPSRALQLLQGSEDTRACLDHIGIVLCPERFHSRIGYPDAGCAALYSSMDGLLLLWRK